MDFEFIVFILLVISTIGILTYLSILKYNDNTHTQVTTPSSNM